MLHTRLSLRAFSLCACLLLLLTACGSANRGQAAEPTGTTALSSPTTTPTPAVTALPSGEVIYRQHSDFVNSIAWSPNGKYIATASDDKTSQIWESATGTLVTLYRDQPLDANSASWSPDGKLIASGGRDYNVHVWNVTTGQDVLVYRGHSDVVESVAWSPNGKYLALGNEVYDVE